MVRCSVCNREVKDIVEHMKKNHMGRISKQSYEYLKSLGIKNLDEKLAELGLKVEESVFSLRRAKGE